MSAHTSRRIQSESRTTTHWDTLPRDLQVFICWIALRLEKATKIQRAIRAARPFLGVKYSWVAQAFDIFPGRRICFVVGDKVLVQTQHLVTGKRILSVGTVNKVGGTKFLYDCRINYPNGDGKVYYYYSKQKRSEYIAMKYPSAPGWLPTPGPYPIKSIAILVSDPLIAE